MSVEENVEYLKGELQDVPIHGTQRLLVHPSQALLPRCIVPDELKSTTNAIRDINDSMTSRGSAPSIEAYKEHASLQYEIEKMEKAKSFFLDYLKHFEKMSSEFNLVSTKLKSIPRGELSEADESILLEFENDIQLQLSRYNYGSTPPYSVLISRSSYRPINDEHEISPYSISASDYIRLIWSYHIALRRSAGNDGKHIGSIFFDEPRQQSANEYRFSALIREFIADKDWGIRPFWQQAKRLTH